MAQRLFERVRRVELALDVKPSHYEPGTEAAERAAVASAETEEIERIGA
jgi:hypothetical protein